jgi:hypothetical protein
MLLSLRKVYLKQINNHFQLTTIADKVIRKEVDQAIIDGQLRILYRKLEVIIRLVQFVPEEEVRLWHSVSEELVRTDDDKGLPGRAGTP